MLPVRSAWAEHIKACHQSPETDQTIVDAEPKLVRALREAEKACKEAEQSDASAYSETVDSALSADGLSRLDAAPAQFITSEIVARSVSSGV